MATGHSIDTPPSKQSDDREFVDEIAKLFLREVLLARFQLSPEDCDYVTPQSLAGAAYDMAEAMLAERKRRRQLADPFPGV